MEEVIPGIWLGDSQDAKNTEALTAAGIRSLLNVAWDLSYSIDPAFIQAKIGLIDGPGNRTGAFRIAVETLANLATMGPVLIHCHAGKSRSPSVLAAYLVMYRNCKSLKGAYDYIYESRPSMDPDFDPKQALKELAAAYLKEERVEL